jgi:hypothetical protein
MTSAGINFHIFRETDIFGIQVRLETLGWFGKTSDESEGPVIYISMSAIKMKTVSCVRKRLRLSDEIAASKFEAEFQM